MWFTLFPRALGDCGLAWRAGTVLATALPGPTPAATADYLATRTGPGAVRIAPPADRADPIARAIAAITALLDGAPADLTSIACDFTGLDPFAARVYAATRAIPAGETRTYGDIATALGNRALARNVGQALGRNRFPIIIPCHRVMGAGGKLT
ncbi:MAG: MGMT family protein, partial [Pseudomonadota bacterium]